MFREGYKLRQWILELAVCRRLERVYGPRGEEEYTTGRHLVQDVKTFQILD